MSTIPLHLQRKFEQRWAARFVSPVASAAPKNTAFVAARKSKRNTRRVEQAGLVSTCAGGALPRLQGRGIGLSFSNDALFRVFSFFLNLYFWNSLMSFALTQRRALARFRKTAVLIVATAHFVVDGVLSYVTRPITVWIAKANAALGRFFATLSCARAFSGSGNHPGTGKASSGIFDGDRSFRAITFVTAEVLKLTFVEQLFQLNRKKLLSVPAFALGLATNNGLGRIDGSLEGVTTAGRRRCTFASDSLASIQASSSPSITLVSQVNLHVQTRRSCHLKREGRPVAAFPALERTTNSYIACILTTEPRDRLTNESVASGIAVPKGAVAIAAAGLIFHFIFRRADQGSLQQR